MLNQDTYRHSRIQKLIIAGHHTMWLSEKTFYNNSLPTVNYHTRASYYYLQFLFHRIKAEFANHFYFLHGSRRFRSIMNTNIQWELKITRKNVYDQNKHFLFAYSYFTSLYTFVKSTKKNLIILTKFCKNLGPSIQFVFTTEKLRTVFFSKSLMHTLLMTYHVDGRNVNDYEYDWE